MIHSMTGFGAGRAREGEVEIAVEVRAVNHKFCEVKARLAPELAALEQELVRQVKEAVRRGALEVSVRLRVGGGSVLAPRVDLALARELVAALDSTAEALNLPRNLGIAELAQVDGVVTLESKRLDLDQARAALRSAADQALAALRVMREREGLALAEDVRGRLAALREGARRVAELSPATIDRYRARLEERVAELSKGLPVDPQRLAQEVALFADRIDIAEEITRLHSHLDQFEQLLRADEPSGRKMDFLTQELHREVNTSGSKSQSAEIAQIVVGMKAEIERLREQVQNIE